MLLKKIPDKEIRNMGLPAFVGQDSLVYGGEAEAPG